MVNTEARRGDFGMWKGRDPGDQKSGLEVRRQKSESGNQVQKEAPFRGLMLIAES
jgi:hypothetical protein